MLNLYCIGPNSTIIKVLQKIIVKKTLQLVLSHNLDPSFKIQNLRDRTTFKAWMCVKFLIFVKSKWPKIAFF